MSRSEPQDMDDEIPDYSGENDRRKEPRRVLIDRRDLIRYEINKNYRRSGLERRQVKAFVNDEEDIEEDDLVVEETILGTVITKITKLFSR